MEVEVDGNPGFVEVTTGGPSTQYPVGPDGKASIPIPALPPGTRVAVFTGKGLNREIILIEVVEQD